MQATILFKNAQIIDGTGSVAYNGSVAVKEDTIVAVTTEDTHIDAQQVIDLDGKVLVPGFIDMHGHSDLYVLHNPSMLEKVSQGITTEVIGNCGMGVYPLVHDPHKRTLLAQMAADILGTYTQKWPWSDFLTYKRAIDTVKCRTKVVGLQAHAPLRIAAMEGNPNRVATPNEIKQMVALLHTSYDQGAVGFSSGLYYAPCFFASEDELMALLHATAERDRLFAVHHRCEGDNVVESLREVLELALKTNVRIEISHLKAIGKRNQQYVPQMLKLLEEYQEKGLWVGFDQYPYTFGSTSLYSLLPPSFLQLPRNELMQALTDNDKRQEMRSLMESPQGWDSIVSLCGWDAISVMHIDGKEALKGKSLAVLATQYHLDPYDYLFNLLSEAPETAIMADITQSEESLQMIMDHPLGVFGTDALYSTTVRHVRSSEATRHILARYTKEMPIMPLERMIARMTKESAKRLRLADRGLITVGYKADLVVLDMQKLTDGESQIESGIDMVFIDGDRVI